jgi:pyruvate/2-oxoglutarate dehydrogenase complex dihydrolipoamide dehydrogenase (E3) component
MANYEYDLAVIGGGSGGYAAARAATHAGLKTAVIEGGKELGGLCILRGCMPTKALLHVAEVLHHSRHSSRLGLRPHQIGFAFPQIMARKDRLIREFAEYRLNQLTEGPFQFIRAQARFIDPHTVALSSGGTLTADHFVISTGSLVAPAPLPELSEIRYLTSDDVLSLSQLPKSLLVLGGGAVAVELAQFFARLDVKVILIQRSEHLLRDFDPDAAEVLETVFRREGIELYTNTELLGAFEEGGLKGVSFLHQGKETIRVTAEEILFALGRIPNTASLDVENAGVYTEKHRVITNVQMQTSVPHIYAAGDCRGLHEIVHLAVQQGEIAAHNIAHPEAKRSIDYRLLTTVIFTDPQIAQVGLSEKEARQLNIPHLAAKYPFNDHGKAMIMEATDGFVKLVADPKTGVILGGTIAGYLGGELIHEIIACMAKHMTVHELAALPHYHPTLAEIWTYPAEELAGRIPA